MIDIRTYQRIKKGVDQLQTEADQSQGALDQLLRRLKKTYGCDTVEEAGELLGRKEQELKEAEELYERRLAEFQEAWGDELDRDQ